MHLLHVHSHDHAHASELICFLDEVVLHGLLDTLKLVPFLFLTYLLMEFIEHKASDKVFGFMRRAGRFGPFAGAALGVIPQCGFSAAASNLYTGRVVSLGTLIAVFLSTSDEMIPIFLAGGEGLDKIGLIILYKVAVAISVGFAIDAVMHFLRRDKQSINIDELCENDECHCERGIWFSALHHTVTISVFVLAVTLLINGVIFFVGEQTLGSLVGSIPVLSHLIAAVVGLIPNCAASVLLATLCSKGIISVGVMLAGLFSGAGVGLLVLYKVNRHMKENAIITGILVIAGMLFGLLGELIFAV